MVTRRLAIGGLAGSAVAGFGARAAATELGVDALSSAIHRLGAEGRYLPAWARLLAIHDPMDLDTPEQWAAFLGDESIALAHAADPNATGPAHLSGAVAEDAVAAIVRASAGRRVVMLNEAHVASRHRMFLARLLPALRREGFTHLAAETFLNTRDPLAPHVETLQRGDPLKPGHGWYTADPVYAETVREALELGYGLVAYEERPDQVASSADSTHVDPNREQSQAENLAAALARAPDSRFIVYVGYGHITKMMDLPGGPRFAGRFQRLTGIEPLTVVQDSSGSFGPHAPDAQPTRDILAKFAPRSPIIVRGSDRQVLGTAPGVADFIVVHPALADVNGRPGWLAHAPGRHARTMRLRAPSPAGLALAQAVPAAESDPAIPADQYLLRPGARDLTFHLRPGRYRVRLETLDGFTVVGEVTA